MSATEFPHLRDFVRGYLHEDAAEEYGSAAAAVRQFLADADARKAEALRREVRALVERFRDLGAINVALAALGAKWEFQTDAEFEEFTAAVRGPGSGQM